MSADPKEVIERFYGAFAAKDADGMEACYHPQVSFSDPVFTDLHGEDVMRMWAVAVQETRELIEGPWRTADAAAT